MKRLFCLILCLALAVSLAACGPAPSGPTETAANPFTQGTTAAPSQAATSAATQPPTTEPAPSEPETFGLGICMGNLESPDPSDPAQASLPPSFLSYTGGEMTISLGLMPEGLETVGLGILLFVDGYPQPYRAEGDTEASYMHVFFPPDRTDDFDYYDLTFVPVTGKAGDTLDVWVHAIRCPELFPTIRWSPSLGDMLNSGVSLRFLADPPQTELPSIQDRLVSQTVTVEELRTEDLHGSTIDQLQAKNNFQTTVEDWENKDLVFYLSAREDMTIHLRSVAYGAASTEYRLVVFRDNVPISVADEDLPALHYGDGEKIIVDTVVDLAGFDGSSLVYAVLVPRNSIVKSDGTIEWTGYVRSWSSTAYFFSSADTQEELFGK